MIMLCLGAALANEPVALSLEDAIARAIDQNPDLIQAQASVEAAQGALTQSWSAFEPTLTASTSYNRSLEQSVFPQLGLFLESSQYRQSSSLGVSSFLPTGTTLSANLSANDVYNLTSDLSGGEVFEQETQSYTTSLTGSIRQSLLQGFRTTYNMAGVRNAARSLARADAAAVARRQQVLADTANAYWNLLYQQNLAKISAETLEITREERRVVLARIEQGDLAPVERARVEAAALEAESNLLTTEGAAEAAAESLLLLLGMAPDTPLTITSVPTQDTGDPIDPALALAEARENNADLLQLRESEELAQESLRNARHAMLPELTGLASYSLSGFDEDDFGAAFGELTTGDLRGWSVGAELAVPLGNRADRGALEQRTAELRQATASREAYERTLAQQVRAQIRALQVARLQIQLAEANLSAAEQTLSADQALRDAGRAIEKDVLESIRDVENARVSLAKARVDYNLAFVELSRLRGTL